MAATVVKFRDGENPVLKDTFTQRVWLKSDWSADWIEYPYLFAVEVAWSTAPTLPTASLQWLYGEIKQYDDDQFVEYLKSTEMTRLWVRVQFYDGPGASGEPDRTWFGVIEQTSDQLGAADVMAGSGSVPRVATGSQLFTAYGLDKLLYDHQVIDAVTSDSSRRVEVPPVFNRDNRGNKTAGDVDGSPVFECNPKIGTLWDTYSIVSYLLSKQTPRGPDGGALVTFELDAAADLPDYDKPQLEQEGLTTYELLDRLINRRRMAVWSIGVDEEASPAKAVVRVHSMLAQALSLPSSGAPDLNGNDRPRHLVFDDDPLTSAAINATGVELVDQVIVRGARRRSVGSFSILDGSIARGWTTEQEEKYQEGSTQASGGTRKKCEMHREARGRPELVNVHTFFRIEYGWDRKVGDGEGGSQSPMFPIEDSDESFPVYYPDMWIEPTMPLIEGVDYSGDAIEAESFELPDEERQEATPWVFVRPAESGSGSGSGSGRWKLATHVGDNSDLEVIAPKDYDRWSVAVRVPPKSQGVYLDVSGAPQHILYSLDFTYLPDEPRLGLWSYDNPSAGMIITLSIPDDRYCEGKWPETVGSGSGSGSGDGATRRKLIWAGDTYRKDYVAPNTVVGLDGGGGLLRSDGGYIPKESDTDDETKLKTVAKVAAQWYTVERFVLTLETYRLLDEDRLRVGDMVAEVGDDTRDDGHRQTIETVVTEIRITSAMGTPESTEPPRMTIQTGMGQLDPFGILPESSAHTVSGMMSPAAGPASRPAPPAAATDSSAEDALWEEIFAALDV